MASKPSIYKAIRAEHPEQIAAFINSTLVVNPASRIMAAALYERYLQWYDALYAAGEIPFFDKLRYGIEYSPPPMWERMSLTMFGRHASVFLPKRLAGTGRFYIGYALDTATT